MAAAGLRATLGLPFCFAVLVGCGGSGRAGAGNGGHRVPAAVAVCQRVGAAARPLLGAGLKTQIADSDPANIECRLQGEKTRVDVVAQASPQAWTQFDTTAVHQAQAFGAGGATENTSLLPQMTPLTDGQAAWIQGERELVATNGTQSRGGSYVTVTITGGSRPGSTGVRLATAVARATLASAPRGPSPGPPPS